MGEADVGVIDIDVDELPEAPGIIVEAIVEAWIRGVEIGQHLADRAALDAHFGAAIGEPAKWSRNANHDCHCGPEYTEAQRFDRSAGTRAAAAARSPPGRIRPAARSSLTRRRLVSVQELLARRGVKRSM